MADDFSLTARAWSGYTGLHASATEWARVLLESDADPFFNSASWVKDYANAFVDDEDIFGWTLDDEDGLPAAVLAFRLEPPRSKFALRRVTFLADGSFDSDYLDLVYRRTRTMEVLSTAIDLLATQRRAQAVVFTGIPDSSPTLPTLRAILRRRRLPFRVTHVPCCAVPLPGTFDEFLAALKPRMRGKVRSALRKGEEQGAMGHWCDEPALLPLHLEALYDLHRRRWEMAGEAGSFADERRCQLYETSMPRLMRSGRLRMSRLTLDGDTVAYQLGVLEGGRYYQLQEGYEPEVQDIRLGINLRAWSIARLIEEGVRSYDFLAGIMPHKTDWGAEYRPTTTIAFALPRWRARLSYGLRAMLDRRTPPSS